MEIMRWSLPAEKTRFEKSTLHFEKFLLDWRSLY